MNSAALLHAPFVSLLAAGIALAAAPCRADEPFSPVISTPVAGPGAWPIAIPASTGPPAYRVVREDLTEDAFIRSALEFGLRNGATVVRWRDSSYANGDRSGTAVGPSWGVLALVRLDNWGIGVSFERSVLSWPAREVKYPTAQFTMTAVQLFVRFPFLHSGRADPYFQVGLGQSKSATLYNSSRKSCSWADDIAASVELGADWFATDVVKLGPYVAAPLPFPVVPQFCSTEDAATSHVGPAPPTLGFTLSFGLATTFSFGEPLKSRPDHRY